MKSVLEEAAPRIDAEHRLDAAVLHKQSHKQQDRKDDEANNEDSHNENERAWVLASVVRELMDFNLLSQGERALLQQRLNEGNAVMNAALDEYGQDRDLAKLVQILADMLDNLVRLQQMIARYTENDDEASDDEDEEDDDEHVAEERSRDNDDGDDDNDDNDENFQVDERQCERAWVFDCLVEVDALSQSESNLLLRRFNKGDTVINTALDVFDKDCDLAKLGKTLASMLDNDTEKEKGEEDEDDALKKQDKKDGEASDDDDEEKEEEVDNEVDELIDLLEEIDPRFFST